MQKTCIIISKIYKVKIIRRNKDEKIKGPAIFLAQFAGDEEPFNNLKDISSWA